MIPHDGPWLPAIKWYIVVLIHLHAIIFFSLRPIISLSPYIFAGTLVREIWGGWGGGGVAVDRPPMLPSPWAWAMLRWKEPIFWKPLLVALVLVYDSSTHFWIKSLYHTCGTTREWCRYVLGKIVALFFGLRFFLKASQAGASYHSAIADNS